MKQFERIKKRKLGEILVDEGYVSREQLDGALEIQNQSGDLLGKILVEQGFLTERALAKAIANQLQLPYLSSENYQLSKDVVGLIPPDLCFKYEFVPLDKIGSCLVILMSGVLSMDVLETIQQITACEVFVYIGTSSDVQRCLQEWVSQAALTQAEFKVDDSWMNFFDKADESIRQDTTSTGDEEHLAAG